MLAAIYAFAELGICRVALSGSICGVFQKKGRSRITTTLSSVAAPSGSASKYED